MDENEEYGGGSWNMISNFTSPNNSTTSQDPLFLSPQHQQFHHQQHQQQFQQQPQQPPQQQPQPQFVHPSPQQQFMQQQQHSPFQQQHSPFQQQHQQQQHSPFQQQHSPFQQQHSPYHQHQIQHSPLQQQLQQQHIVQQSPQQFVQQIQSPPPPPQQHQQQQNQSLASHFHLINLVENLADTIDNGTRDQHADAVISELNSQFEKCQQLLNSISGTINAKVMTVEGQKHKLEESEQLLNQRRDLISTYKRSVEELVKSEP